jgi:HPt (histidine-containing phosphotransfer) domain-containing protein
MDLLQMLVDTIGDEMVRASVKVFQEKMPEYMEILQLSLSADEKSDVCSEAHKIKGAAGSVGLARVQRIANQIQQGDHPTWWENVHDWVEELQMAVQHDMKALHDWLRYNFQSFFKLFLKKRVKKGISPFFLPIEQERQNRSKNNAQRNDFRRKCYRVL